MSHRTRKDISFEICRISRHASNPAEKQYFLAHRFQKYLNTTQNFGILYDNNATKHLMHTYSIADYEHSYDLKYTTR